MSKVNDLNNLISKDDKKLFQIITRIGRDRAAGLLSLHETLYPTPKSRKMRALEKKADLLSEVFPQLNSSSERKVIRKKSKTSSMPLVHAFILKCVKSGTTNTKVIRRKLSNKFGNQLSPNSLYLYFYTCTGVKRAGGTCTLL